MRLLLFLISIYCVPAFAFVTGFNQAWLKNNYGNSFANATFDAPEARRLLKATHDAGGQVLRVWLFESGLVNQVDFDGRRPVRIKPEVLSNFRLFLNLAAEEKVKIYLTLFDGNVSKFGNNSETKDRFWNILNDKYGYGQDFLDNVLAPVIDLQNEIPNIYFGIDLSNEANAFLKPWGGPWFEKGWPGLNTFAKKWGDWIRAHSSIPVSISLGWSKPEAELLDGKLEDADLDFYDFHQYNNSGNLPRCAEVRDLQQRSRKPVYLGEFGQLWGGYDDEKQDAITWGFLNNAHNCGLAGAFAWRLSESLPANVQADFLSFESYGRFRPAYDTFRLFSTLYARLW